MELIRGFYVKAPILAFPQMGEGDARTDGFTRKSTN
jgi:hypothetical protein